MQKHLPGCFHWSRTKVRGSKTIRYRRSLNHKRCRLGIGGWRLNVHFGTLPEIKVFGFWGVWSQGWNLKELTEGHHQEWSLRLNLTQHGKTHQVRTWEGLTDWELFLDSMGGGAWPFLVGGVICLVNSERTRGPLPVTSTTFDESAAFLEGLLGFSNGSLRQ